MAANEDEEKPEARRPIWASVRISPCYYAYDDADGAECAWLRDVYGRMYVQERHLASSAKATWN